MAVGTAVSSPKNNWLLAREFVERAWFLFGYLSARRFHTRLARLQLDYLNPIGACSASDENHMAVSPLEPENAALAYPIRPRAASLLENEDELPGNGAEAREYSPDSLSS